MECIEGEALARIKYRIKFGQRTPLRLFLTFLKMYRHEGMFLDPAYLFVSALQTMTKGTWLEKTLVFPWLLAVLKRVLKFRIVHRFHRLAARVLMPVVSGVNYLFEKVDAHLQLTTTFLPRIFLRLDTSVFKKQRDMVQIRGFMQDQNPRAKMYSC